MIKSGARRRRVAGVHLVRAVDRCGSPLAVGGSTSASNRSFSSGSSSSFCARLDDAVALAALQVQVQPIDARDRTPR